MSRNGLRERTEHALRWKRRQRRASVWKSRGESAPKKFELGEAQASVSQDANAG